MAKGLADNVRRLADIKRRLAQMRFADFLDYITPTYDRQWFHTIIANKCQALIEGTLGTNRLMVFVPPQHGKALPIDTPVFTTKGWKNHGDLNDGDYVFGADGKPKAVIANSGAYEWNVQTMSFQCGYSIECAKEHLWKLSVEYDDHKGRREVVQEAGEIYKRKHRRSPAIECAPALQTEERQLPIDPYILGVWLGDGLKGQGVFVEGEDIEYWSQFGETRRVKPTYYRIKVDGLYKALRESGILRYKHIPIDYLLSSVEQRTALLCGIMDTDGTVGRDNGNCEFCQKEGQLAEDVYTLIRSLGYKARRNTYDMKLNGRIVGKKVRILFNPDKDAEIFRLPRKKVRLIDKTKGDRGDKNKFFITSYGSKPRTTMVNCIQVEGGMYLAGRDLIPTHNSQIVSRSFPAWYLGKNPKAKIVGCSYSAELAQQFSRAIQRTIDSEEYSAAFPKTYLNSPNVSTDARKGYLRNIDIFETVGYGGFYKAVGVGGSLTGTPVDLGIIDDPVKDAMEANSQTYRDRVWAWYTDVFLTRLHNESKQIFIMTRWHEDDLAGRLLKQEPDKWTVVKFPALKEDDTNPEDPRQIGEALWEARHSRERLLEVEARSPRTFASLYQQRPVIIGGNIVKREWFQLMPLAEFNRIHNGEPIIFFIDTAY
ncbi:MAG: terminase family protein, partial [Bacteroidales bacterium]|nr:terminase family protein [Bacteroidales bacterium]